MRTGMAAAGQVWTDGMPAGGFLLRLLGRKQERKREKQKAFRAQAAYSNRTGRHRTQDFQIPSKCERAAKEKGGTGKWKGWTADAVLRAAFAKETSTVRGVSDQVDGSSGSHASLCKLFAAQLIMQGQERGLKDFLRNAQAEAGPEGFSFALSNMIFDETELEICLQGFGVGAWSVLASHSQLTFRLGGKTHDFDIVRSPVAIPDKKAHTMWLPLCAELGGLWPGLSPVPAKLKVVLTTSDAAPTNIRLLKHLQCCLDKTTLFFPFLCLQHRTGNVVERVTKCLGVLTGCYAVAKTLSSGSAQRKLLEQVREVLSDEVNGLVVLDEVPAGMEDEWASGQVWAGQILALSCQGEAQPKRHKEFLEFFAGPWSGLGGLVFER